MNPARPLCLTRSFATEDMVFGPRDIAISRWHLHLSLHTFSVDVPGEGTLILSKKTPEKRIEGGFLFLNNRFFSLHDFLQGKDESMEREVALRTTNYLIVFLRGAPGAKLSLEVRKGATTPPPQVTFQAEPQAINLGETSTLEWTTTYADSVTIDQGIGDVSPSGSLSIRPQQTTTYTITATGEGGMTTKSVTIEVRIPPPGVTLSADPETIRVGDPATLAWVSTDADSCTIEPGIGRVDLKGSLSVSPTTTTTYVRGLLDSMTDPDGVVQFFDYDVRYGRLAVITDGDGNYIAYTYEPYPRGNLTEQSKFTSDNSRTCRKRWSYEHPDYPGKLYREIQSDNTYHEYGYDAAGNPTLVTATPIMLGPTVFMRLVGGRILEPSPTTPMATSSATEL